MHIDASTTIRDLGGLDAFRKLDNEARKRTRSDVQRRYGLQVWADFRDAETADRRKVTGRASNGLPAGHVTTAEAAANGWTISELEAQERRRGRPAGPLPPKG